MTAEREILQALAGLPPAAIDQVKDFIAFLKEKQAPRQAADRRKTLARKQLAAITKWAGANLDRGFSGREHDAILYGSEK